MIEKQFRVIDRVETARGGTKRARIGLDPIVPEGEEGKPEHQEQGEIMIAGVLGQDIQRMSVGTVVTVRVFAAGEEG